jgi:quercetin dioxygenase-like cupin family protein
MKLSELKKVVTGFRGGAPVLEVRPPVVIKAPQSDDDHWAACHWISDHPTRIEADDLSGTWRERLPPSLGSAFRLFQFAPAGQPGASGEFHTTHSIDYVVIVSGRLWLILENEEVELNPGDTVVQRGVPHRWENRGDEPCFAASVMIAAE